MSKRKLSSVGRLYVNFVRISGVIVLLVLVLLSLFSTKDITVCLQQITTEHQAFIDGIDSYNNNNNNNFQTAYDESLGYFDDIPLRDWEEMRNITLKRVNNVRPGNVLFRRKNPNAWYQSNWDPDFSCRHDTKVGIGDGAKWVCDPLRLKRQFQRRLKVSDDPLSARCIVYSVGSNGDFRFEQGVEELLPGVCEIHTFDFTNYEDRVPPLPPGRNGTNPIQFHHWGLKPSYNETKNTVDGKWGARLVESTDQPFKTFEETIAALGHQGRPIDIFKIDCEGCEWYTYKDWVTADIRQLLVEVHRVPEIANDFFVDFQQAGYVTYHKEPNIEFGGGECVEYAMLKLSREYVENRIR